MCVRACERNKLRKNPHSPNNYNYRGSVRLKPGARKPILGSPWDVGLLVLGVASVAILGHFDKVKHIVMLLMPPDKEVAKSQS